jgi:hypothetical protein
MRLRTRVAKCAAIVSGTAARFIGEDLNPLPDTETITFTVKGQIVIPRKFRGANRLRKSEARIPARR